MIGVCVCMRLQKRVLVCLSSRLRVCVCVCARAYMFEWVQERSNSVNTCARAFIHRRKKKKRNTKEEKEENNSLTVIIIGHDGERLGAYAPWQMTLCAAASTCVFVCVLREEEDKKLFLLSSLSDMMVNGWVLLHLGKRLAGQQHHEAVF